MHLEESALREKAMHREIQRVPYSKDRAKRAGSET
jgi:hypothetical protein